jgi:hypothetical protein
MYTQNYEIILSTTTVRFNPTVENNIFVVSDCELEE